MSALEERLEALRTRFLVRARADQAALLVARKAGDTAEIRRLCHGLAGAAGTFGFPKISAAALRVEEAEDVDTCLPRLLHLLDQPR